MEPPRDKKLRRVRDFKKETGLTQRELARRLRISERSMVRYAYGVTQPLPTIEAQIQKLRQVFPGDTGAPDRDPD